ncbi:MAG: YrbL family protein [Xanthobacteraceae bacterium]
MMHQPKFLRLAGQAPLVTGSWKLVFQHPHDEGLLVKVVNREGNVSRSRKTWYKARPREGNLLPFSRELLEFVVAEANSNGRPSPIPRIVGLVETDLGLGLVVEKIRGRTGELATTLIDRLPQTGLTLKIEQMLAALIADINQRRIVLTEFRPRNIVIVDAGKKRSRLMLVDGFGDSSLIGLHSLSKFANTRRNLRKYRKTLRRLKLKNAESID